MKYRFFHVSALDPQAGETALNDFCARHRVSSIEKSLVVDGPNSYWTFCVGYLDGTEKLPVGRKGRIDYREVLDEADFAVFAKLRSLRKELSEREGVPAYALFTNEQLAEMVTGRVASLADLQAIDGIGEAKVRKYGESFLAELKIGRTEINGSAAHASNTD
jgi:superfamily II DNA helicase RecQ